MPPGTKLLNFSPAGRYLVTWEYEQSWLTLWDASSGEANHRFQLPVGLIPTTTSPNAAQAYFDISNDDHWLAVTPNTPDDPHLDLVDLTTGELVTRVAALPSLSPRPSFSADGRYLTYQQPLPQAGDRAVVASRAGDCQVLYEIDSRRERLRVPGAFSVLGPPTPQGKWLVHTESGIQCWDLASGQHESTLPSLPVGGWGLGTFSLAADG